MSVASLPKTSPTPSLPATHIQKATPCDAQLHRQQSIRIEFLSAVHLPANMPPKKATASKAASAKPSSPAKNAYLILYNFASAVAWSVVLGRTVMLLQLHGHTSVYGGVGEWTKWTQTAALMEVAHSLLGASATLHKFAAHSTLLYNCSRPHLH